MALTKMPEAAFVEVNQAFLTLFEVSRDKVLGKTSVDLGISDPAAQAEVRARFTRDGFVRNFECTRRTLSASLRNLVLDLAPLEIGGAPHVLTTVRDITALRQAEQKLVEQTALVRMGEMMTVVAHEVRNPLARIRMVLQLLGSRLPRDGPEEAAAREAIGHVDALTDLVHELLTFARPQPPRVGQIDIRSLLERTIDFFRHDPQAAGLVVSLEGTGLPVAGDAHQLTRVFLNLLRNAAQAMNGRGRVEIRIGGGKETCTVSVMDTGPGMPPDVRVRLFQPFFTTKASGTGLGLATVKQILELHGGSIAVESEPGRGTAVTVALPVWQPALAPELPGRRARPATPLLPGPAAARPGDEARTSPCGSAPGRD